MQNTIKRVKITADNILLDIVSTYPATEAVFKSYDERVGECICCQMLFESVQQVTEKYNLNLNKLLRELNSVLKSANEDTCKNPSN